MMRFCLPVLLFLLAVTGASVAAPAATPSLEPPPRHATEAKPPPPALTPAQAQQVLQVLLDPKKRAEFVDVLENMAKAAPAVAAPAASGAATTPAAKPPASAAAGHAAAAPAAKPATALPIPLAPNSLGAEVLVGASQWLSRLSLQVMDTTRQLTNFPLLSRWVTHLAHSREAREQVSAAAWRLLVVMAAAVAVERLAERLLRPAAATLARRAPEPPPPLPEGEQDEHAALIRRRGAALAAVRRLPFLFGRLLLDLLPLLLLAATGYAILGTSLGDRETARLVILAVLNAYLLTRVVVTVTRVLLAPYTPRLRLVGLSDEAAIYLTRWIRRIAIIAIFGYTAAEVGLLFGLYRVTHDALIKLVSLAVHLCLVIIVLQTRRPVAEMIRARPGATGAAAVLRNRLAAAWHVIAVFYIVALWLVWAFEVPNGFAHLIRIFISTVVIGTLARLVSISATGAMDRALRIDPALATRYPGLEARTRRYQPVGRMVISGIVTAVAAVVLFEAWGVDSFSWFGNGALGGRLVSALVSMGLTLLASLAVWELANAAMQRRLERTSRGGQAARMRTLLPMLRTALFVSISIIAGLIVLSEIGVNIAPLLAGAGVVGIAIGFGSQKLVQDLITGIFLLFENAMQVGDWVTVSGLSGTVEHLSIRTIRLRAGDGSVHIIPFSAVTSVTNVNRGIGNAAVNVAVDIHEDIDRVCAVLAEIVTGMRAEKQFSAGIISDLQLWGVDKVEAGGVTIVGQIVCTDSGRWGVQREFNKRVQKRFAELGIRYAIPVQRTALDPVQLQPQVLPAEVPPMVQRAASA